MGKPGNTGIRRILRAFVFTAQGFGHAWKHEAAFRQEVILTIVLLPIALWLGQTVWERALLIGVDRFGPEQHELAGRAKDMGSAAVFVSLGLVAFVWAAVAWQRFVA